MKDEEPDAVGDQIGWSGRSKYRITFTLLAIVVVGILAAFWFRSSISSETDGNFTTTTDPFVHIDTNQNVDEDRGNANAAVTANETASEITNLPANSGWDSSIGFDRVRDAPIYRAAIESQNAVHFDFPYNGGSVLTMTARRHPAYGDDVIFEISKGQFVCPVDDCNGTINFGSGAESLLLSEPTDNSSDTLFATNGEYIIERLKKAKTVTVELPFYQEGNRQFVFQMKSPLTWPPAGSHVDETPDPTENSELDD
jgi:hypothetical protein